MDELNISKTTPMNQSKQSGISEEIRMSVDEFKKYMSHAYFIGAVDNAGYRANQTSFEQWFIEIRNPNPQPSVVGDDVVKELIEIVVDNSSATEKGGIVVHKKAIELLKSTLSYKQKYVNNRRPFDEWLECISENLKSIGYRFTSLHIDSWRQLYDEGLSPFQAINESEFSGNITWKKFRSLQLELKAQHPFQSLIPKHTDSKQSKS